MDDERGSKKKKLRMLGGEDAVVVWRLHDRGPEIVDVPPAVANAFDMPGEEDEEDDGSVVDVPKLTGTTVREGVLPYILPNGRLDMDRVTFHTDPEDLVRLMHALRFLNYDMQSLATLEVCLVRNLLLRRDELIPVNPSPFFGEVVEFMEHMGVAGAKPIIMSLVWRGRAHGWKRHEDFISRILFGMSVVKWQGVAKFVPSNLADNPRLMAYQLAQGLCNFVDGIIARTPARVLRVDPSEAPSDRIVRAFARDQNRDMYVSDFIRLCMNLYEGGVSDDLVVRALAEVAPVENLYVAVTWASAVEFGVGNWAASSAVAILRRALAEKMHDIRTKVFGPEDRPQVAIETMDGWIRVVVLYPDDPDGPRVDGRVVYARSAGAKERDWDTVARAAFAPSDVDLLVGSVVTMAPGSRRVTFAFRVVREEA